MLYEDSQTIARFRATGRLAPPIDHSVLQPPPASPGSPAPGSPAMYSIRRRGMQAYYLGALFTFSLYGLWHMHAQPCYTCLLDNPLRSKPADDSNDSLIPELAHVTGFSDTGPSAEFCRRRFTPAYLEELQDNSIQYCAPNDDTTLVQSQLTCFHAHVRSDNGVDSFCIGSGATWNSADKKFALRCPTIRSPDQNETDKGLIPFSSVAASWFSTGPRRVFDRFVSFDGSDAAPPSSDQPARNVILVKREGNNNLWHSLMEIQSMMSSIDVLRMSHPHGTESASTHPFFQHPYDVENTHIVMLDNYPEESTFDLWRFFSHNPIIKLVGDEASPAMEFPLREEDGPFNIIVPMSGGMNPTWQNDWVDHTDCTQAPLIDLLVQRVYEHYNVVREDPPLTFDHIKENAMRITFIDRKGSRQLIGSQKLLARLEEKYPDALIQSLDFATLNLADQLRIVQDTDILVGVHGAGLTHIMFMRESYGAVVEIQPEGMGHKGFANMAAMTGHEYLMVPGQIVLPEEVDQYDEEKPGDERPPRDDEKPRPWQSSHVHLEVEPFLDVMKQAVERLAQRAKETRKLHT